MNAKGSQTINHNVHFARGTGGSFIINCIKFYLQPEIFNRLSLGETGDAHPRFDDIKDQKYLQKIDNWHTWFIGSGTHYHDELNKNKHNIFITFEEEDYPIISEMFLVKVLQYNLTKEEYKMLAGSDWVDFKDWFNDEFTRSEIKENWLSSLIDWKKTEDLKLADTIIKFKDIHHDDNLNNKLASICNREPIQEVEDYITKYRYANKVYWQ